MTDETQLEFSCWTDKTQGPALALADPQSVTIAAVPIPLPRTSTGQDASQYTSADGLIRLTASSSYGKRTRRTVRLTHNKVASDPLLAGQSVPVSMTAYVVFDTPLVGYTTVQQKEVWDGFVTALTASTGALVTKVLGGEN